MARTAFISLCFTAIQKSQMIFDLLRWWSQSVISLNQLVVSSRTSQKILFGCFVGGVSKRLVFSTTLLICN